jgi:magnesium chelatase subunit D
VLGTLDLERALQAGERHFEPGLLARANRGLLYVDEVNLLPDHLVDGLLDAAAMGSNSVERDGVSFTHPAAFVLVGTMNPEEGDLRPQLLDRFALAIDVAGMPEPAERAEVVRRRIAYEADPDAFTRHWQSAEDTQRARIKAARAALPRVQVEDRLLDLIARICTEFDVDGLRADIVIYKAAATLAAYEGRTSATADDVRRAAELALAHRRRRQPFDQPGLDRQRLADFVQGQAPPTPDDEPAPDQVFEVGASPPIAPPPDRDRPRADPSLRTMSQARAPAREGPLGRHVRSQAPSATVAGALDVSATLLAAAPYQRLRGGGLPLRLKTHDVRVKVRQARASALTLFAVDASGSMAAQRRMAAAKGAVVALLTRAYQQRNEVGLIAFRGRSAQLVLPPTNRLDLAYARLRDLPTGGRTPLAAALRLAQETLLGRREQSQLLVLVTDGRANVGLAGGDPDHDVQALAQAVRHSPLRTLVVDSEDGPVRLGLARRLADMLGGPYILLAAHTPLASAVRGLHLAASRP